MIQGLIILNYPDYVPYNWHGTLFAWAVIAVSMFVNIILAGLLPFLEGAILLLHVLGFVALLIALVYLSPHGNASDVFFRTINEGGWSTQGLSFCVGFIGNVATFVGESLLWPSTSRSVTRPKLTTIVPPKARMQLCM